MCWTSFRDMWRRKSSFGIPERYGDWFIYNHSAWRNNDHLSHSHSSWSGAPENWTTYRMGIFRMSSVSWIVTFVICTVKTNYLTGITSLPRKMLTTNCRFYHTRFGTLRQMMPLHASTCVSSMASMLQEWNTGRNAVCFCNFLSLNSILKSNSLRRCRKH